MINEAVRWLNVYWRLAELEKKMANVTAQIKAYTDKVQANFATLKTDIDGIQSGITNLDALISQLETQLSGSALDADTQAALQAVVDGSAALVSQATAVNVTPPAPPAA